MSFLKNILISFLGLFIGLLVIEGFYRLVLVKSVTAKPWSDRPAYYFQHEGSQTLQDYPHTEKKAPQTFRIAVIGDSFTFAPYMQFTDAFPKVLERMLNLNNTPLKAEVINYGVPAYSTSHEVSVAKKAVTEESDLLLLQITLNDPEIKGHTPIGITDFSRFGPPKYPHWLTTLFSYFRVLGFAAERLHNVKTKQDYIDYFSDLFNNERSWNSFRNSLAKIAKIANESGRPIVAVVFPLFGLEQNEAYPFWWIHEKVAAELKVLNVPSMDLSNAYQGIPLDRLQVLPGVDRHPNEIAHRMAAEKIYDWLVEQQKIPSELHIKKRFQKRTQIIKEKPYTD